MHNHWALDDKLVLDGQGARQLRQQRAKMVLLASLSVVVLLCALNWAGQLGQIRLLILSALILGQVLLFAFLLGTGRSLRFNDPSMTGLQTLGASSVLILASFWVTPSARLVPLLVVPMAFCFASFRFGTRALLTLCLVIVAMTAFGHVLASGANAIDMNAAFELTALGMTLTVMSVVGGKLNELRRRTQIERAMTHQAISNLAEAVIAIDTDRRITFLNPSARRLFADPNTDHHGHPVEQLLKFEAGASFKSLLVEGADEPRRPQAIRLLTNPSGGSRSTLGHRPIGDFELSVSSISGAYGRKLGSVLVLRDVSQQNRLLGELGHAATHDELTGLMNRRGFSACLDRLLDDAHSAGSHSLLLIDLDQFKVINDSCGHQAGDDLLCAVASMLRAAFGNALSLARLGGDEFGAVLPNPPSEAVERAEALLRMFAQYRFVRDGRPFKTSASIGVTAVEPSDKADQILARADAACYAAKELGRNQVKAYDEQAWDTVRRRRDLSWVARINAALEDDRFVLYAQRIALTRSACEVNDEFELLLRMIDERGAVIVPGEFLAAAERFNLMPSIDRWVIRQAISQLRKLNACAMPLPHVAINISPSSLRDSSFIDFVVQALGDSALQPSLFKLELTESAAVLNFVQAQQFISRVRAIGCQVALDDVGTGFCSFAHLQKLPVDQIKIDGSFVRKVCDTRLDRVLVESLQRIADVLGVTTVAEFVETDAIAAALREVGVDYLQGYAIHRPEPLDRVLQRTIDTRKPTATALPAGHLHRRHDLLIDA